MQLARIEISGFRGIRRLSLTFHELTVLIGENTWGKSSLIDALCVALPSSGNLYQFELSDFFVDYSISYPQTQDIQIILTFLANHPKELRAGRYRRLKSLWHKDEQGNHRIIYRVSATRDKYHIQTHYSFLDEQANLIAESKSEDFAKELMSLHPVIHLRDARQFERPFQIEKNENTRIVKRINNTTRRLMAIPGHVNKEEMRSCVNSMQALVEHYFSFKDHQRKNPRRQRESLIYGSPLHNKSLSQLMDETQSQQTRLLLLGLLNTYLHAKGSNELRRVARPILIIEDPEGRLHPTHLIRAWNLLDMLPMQKILTTNSGELLAAVPLHTIRRLTRRFEITHASFVAPNELHKDDLRRIGFHIRFHRPSALFARCWLLVEGETEVWLFSELARLCGYSLAAEGVQILEFAQSGLKSLIKVANALGIEWHVISDGDPAGKKYSTTARHLTTPEQLPYRLTELPERDIEHFLYHNGFELFFKDMAKIPYDHSIPAKKVVAKVLKKFAKPDLALAIVSHCEQHGVEIIPKLLRHILKRVINMANAYH